MLSALLLVFNIVVQLILTISIVWAVMSWLIAFDVINLRNRVVASVWNMLNGIMNPLLGWIPRQIRYLGGVDISPIVLWLVLVFVQRTVNSFVATGSLF